MSIKFVCDNPECGLETECTQEVVATIPPIPEIPQGWVILSLAEPDPETGLRCKHYCSNACHEAASGGGE